MSNRNFTLHTGVVLVTEECCTCGVVFAMARDFQQQRQNNPGTTFYCPAGHSQHYIGKSAEQKLREAEVRQQALADQLHAAEAEAEATRTRLLRERHRIANGVCPCCNRSFENVRRHVQAEHPDYDPKALTAPGYKCSCGRSFETLHGLHIHQGRVRPDDWTDPKGSSWHRHLTVTA